VSSSSPYRRRARVVPQERAARPRRLSRRILDAINSQQSCALAAALSFPAIGGSGGGGGWSFLDSRVAAFLAVRSLLTFRCSLHVETRLRSCAVSEYKPARR
jgi:hypothetical protein